MVTSGNTSSILDLGFKVLVEKHWNNTAGEGAYSQKFDLVAEQHFAHYINYISVNDLKLPDSQQLDAVVFLALAVKIHANNKAVKATAKRCLKFLSGSDRQLMFNIMNSQSPLRYARIYMESIPDYLFRSGC